MDTQDTAAEPNEIGAVLCRLAALAMPGALSSYIDFWQLVERGELDDPAHFRAATVGLAEDAAVPATALARSIEARAIEIGWEAESETDTLLLYLYPNCRALGDSSILMLGADSRNEIPEGLVFPATSAQLLASSDAWRQWMEMCRQISGPWEHAALGND